MYDTILQMGRWFGYREDYEDLCRIYMTKKAKQDFRFIAGVIRDLNTQIIVMQSQRKTPMDFALFVRKHEDAKRLMATANLKRGASQTRVIKEKFGARFIQNYYFERDLEKLNQNKLFVQDLLENIRRNFINNRIKEDVNPKLKNLYAFKEIPVIYILDLIEKFHFKFMKENDEKRFLLEYINQRKQLELSKWEVIIDSKSGPSAKEYLDIAGFKINPTKRAATYEENIEQKELIQTVTSKKSSIVTPKTYALTMKKEELEEIQEIADEKKIKFFKAMLNSNKVPKLIITVMNLDFSFRDLTNQNKNPEEEKFLNNLPVVFTLSYIFPKSSIKEKPREVLVNTDIDNPFLNSDYFEDYEDDGDD